MYGEGGAYGGSRVGNGIFMCPQDFKQMLDQASQDNLMDMSNKDSPQFDLHIKAEPGTWKPSSYAQNIYRDYYSYILEERRHKCNCYTRTISPKCSSLPAFPVQQNSLKMTPKNASSIADSLSPFSILVKYTYTWANDCPDYFKHKSIPQIHTT